jgi:hypothetical protein
MTGFGSECWWGQDKETDGTLGVFGVQGPDPDSLTGNQPFEDLHAQPSQSYATLVTDLTSILKPDWNTNKM